MWGQKSQAGCGGSDRGAAARRAEGGGSRRPASRSPSARAWSSICATPSWRGSNCSTRRSIRCSRKSRAEVDLFDRGISRGDTPRLWIDVIAHVAMGRDKRQYRFVQDTPLRPQGAGGIRRHRRHRRGDHALCRDPPDRARARAGGRRRSAACRYDAATRAIVLRSRRWRMLRAFLFGLVIGFAALFAALWMRRVARLAALIRQRSAGRFRRCAAAAAQAARDHGAAPGAGLAVDLVEIVAGRIVVVAGRARGRRHADAGDRAARSGQPDQRAPRDDGRAAPARRRACAAPRAAPRHPCSRRK